MSFGQRVRKLWPFASSLFEAMLWTSWTLLAQSLALGAFLACLYVAVFGLQPTDWETIQTVALESDLDRSFLLMGVTSLGGLFVIVPSVRWWLGRDARRILGLQVPRREQVVFALATVAPIAIVSDLIYETAQRQWLTWANEAGQPLAFLSIAELHQRFQGVPYPVLVAAMALGPAIAEELIFRGIIGRQLIGTWGTIPGVLLTSLFFAAAHVAPAHALGTLPIGILLHWLYLKTKSLWIPILVHFCNNLLAITMVRFELASEVPISTPAVIALLAYLLVILGLLHMRERLDSTSLTDELLAG